MIRGSSIILKYWLFSQMNVGVSHMTSGISKIRRARTKRPVINNIDLNSNKL